MDIGDNGGHKSLVKVYHTSGWQFVQCLEQHALTSHLTDATRAIFGHIGTFHTLWTDG